MRLYYYTILLTGILFPITQQFAFAQNYPMVIQGQVLDAETNKPIPNVNIFLSGTTFGASTDTTGKYILQDSIPAGKYSLVFSHIKYGTDAKALVITIGDTLKVDMLLIPNKTTLDEVTIKAEKDFTWKERFKIFKREFLGSSRLGKQCKIVNPWVLNFKKNRDSLIASAPKEIEVENPALGYKIYCDLVKFHNVGFLTTYLAYYRFEELTPKDNRQLQKWQKARLRAFYGSFRHFASALLHNRLSKEGFYIKYSKTPPLNNSRDNVTKTIKSHQLHHENEILMKDYLNIVYNEREEMEFIKSAVRQGVNLDVQVRYDQAVYQSSWIAIQTGKLKVSDFGIILDNPTKLQTLGYWGWQRVGNLLPFDFFPEELAQKIKLSKIAKVKQLKQYTRNRPQEKVYLHQDKPYYALGDTVWVSGYVVDAQTHKPSNLSGVLYLELIDQKNQLKQQLRLKINRGKAAGDLVLDTTYTPGKYRLRAYTKLMTYGSRDYLFQRNFEVGYMDRSSFEGKLVYQNKTAENQETFDYKLALHNQFSQPLANKSFDVLIKTDEKTYQKQTISTDDQGIIKGTLNIPNSEKSPYVELIAQAKDSIYTASRNFYIPINRTQKKLSFFPEGGNLIVGIPSQVAFKATNRQGLGVSVKGKIVDDKGKEVTTFESKHVGLGSFAFTPKAGKKYTAVINYQSGASQNFELPNALPAGFVLKVSPTPKNRSLLMVRSSSRRRKKFTVIAHCRGISVYTASGTVKRNRPFKATIRHNTLPSGIITFTVFDDQFIPQCERIIFSRNPQKTLQIKVDTTLKATEPREKVTINFAVNSLRRMSPTANLSIAVVDNNLVKENNQHSHILTNLLLTSDIKGHIENPNFYFKDDTYETRQALDLLMMTQGWRRFTWKTVVADNYKTPNFRVEKSLKISGVVTTSQGVPVDNATVSVLSLKNKFFEQTTTYGGGRFTFDKINLNYNANIVFKAKTAKGGTKLKIKLDKLSDTLAIKPLTGDPGMHTKLGQKEVYLQNQAKNIQLAKNLKLDPSIKLLEEVQVSAKKITGQQYTKRNVQIYSQPTYRVRLDSGHFKPQDNELFMNYIQGKIPNLKVFYVASANRYMITFRSSEASFSAGTNEREVMILIDGRPADVEVARTLDLENVAYIDMLSPTKAAMYGMMSNGAGGSAFNGILAVYTKKNYKSRKAYRDRGVRGLIYQNGFYKAREFYVPPYDNPNFTKNKRPDYRSTIYWNPSVKVVNGKASVSFFNADTITNYSVIVEGISTDGEIGRKTYTYEVKNKE